MSPFSPFSWAFLISFILGSSSVEIKSIGIESVIRSADSLFRYVHYEKALYEYQRAFFFSEDILKPRLSANIADCHFAMEDFNMSRNYYDSAIHFSNSDRLIMDYELQKVCCSIMQNNFAIALMHLNDLDVNTDPDLNRRKNLFQGICYFGMGQYDKMQKHFLESFPQSDSLRIRQLQELIGKRKILDRPNPRLAIILSIFFPGAGQVYSGDLKEGLNSLILLSGLVYLGTSGSIVNPFLTIPLIPRYYLGGILHAKEIAGEKRKNGRYEYFLELNHVLPDMTSFRVLFEPDPGEKPYPVNLTISDPFLKTILKIMYMGYKGFISSQDVDACMFSPSCSDYAVEAIEKKGVVIGLLEGLDRLSRCHPFVGRADYPYDTQTMKYLDPL